MSLTPNLNILYQLYRRKIRFSLKILRDGEEKLEKDVKN